MNRLSAVGGANTIPNADCFLDRLKTRAKAFAQTVRIKRKGRRLIFSFRIFNYVGKE